MRKHVPGDKTIEDANDRKMAREIAARGISLKPDVIVGSITPEVVVKPKKVKVKKIVKPKRKVQPFLDYINSKNKKKRRK